MFPGQGVQKADMARDLPAAFPIAQSVFDEANDALGFDLWQEDVNLTAYAQPALLTHATAVMRVIRHEMKHVSYVLGHSLGEYSALVAAGSLSFADAVRVVVRMAALSGVSLIVR